MGTHIKVLIALGLAVAPTMAETKPSPTAGIRYLWRNVTVSGGGFEPRVVFSVAERRLAYLRTDMDGAYRFDTVECLIGRDAESVLCGAGRGGVPMERLLARLIEPDAAPVLADMRERFPSKPFGFWKDAPDAFFKVRAFLD